MKTHTKLLAGFNASVLMGAALVLLAGVAPASAHTPKVVATCDGVTVTLKNYGASVKNSAKVTIDGKSVENATFGKEFVKAYKFTDRTVAHSYTVVIDAPGTAYDVTESNKSKPCPAPAQPPVAKPPVVKPPVVKPPVVTPPVVKPPVAKPPVEKPPVVTPPVVTPPVEKPPVVVPEKPKPLESVKSVGDVNCESKTVKTTTTTVTTGWALDEKSNTWVKAEPKTTVKETVRDATKGECAVKTPPTQVTPPVTDTPPTAVTPPVTPPAPASNTAPVADTTPVADALPSTGADAAWALPLAGGLLLAGVALLLVRRTRRA